MERLTKNVICLGNGHFRHFLVGREPALLVECGVSASAAAVIRQWERMESPPGIGHLLAMHAHFDHVCGIPVLKRAFPDARLAASAAAAEVMANPKVMARFFSMDAEMSRELSAPELSGSEIPDRMVVEEILAGGSVLAAGNAGSLELIDAPGHSPCGLAAWLPEDRVLFVSDSLGFQISDSEIFPIFFHSYRLYVETIHRLSQYPARLLALPHERLWEGEEVAPFFARALAAAQEVRDQILQWSAEGVAEVEIKNRLFQRYYRGELRIYTPENIRLCVDLLVRRSLEE
jgi:glyoxylase-like metal-dependent hydrolase (beta-lactamase superfamily II)